MKYTVFTTILIDFLLAGFLYGQIDPAVPINWTNAGYRGNIPRTYARVINMVMEKGVMGNGSSDDSPAIQSAITEKVLNSPDELTIFYFPGGTYKLNSTITFPDGAKNILFLGDGQSTIFSVPNKTSAFSVGYSSQPQWVDLTSNTTSLNTLTEGATTILVPSGSDIQVNDFIELTVKMGSWLGSYGSGNSELPSTNDYQVGQIVKVTGISTNGSYQQLTLEDKLRCGSGSGKMSFSDATLNPKFRKINSISNVGFENFIVKNTSTLSLSEIQNNTYAIYNFIFSYATDCWVSGVESDSPLNAHIAISNSSGIEIRGCYIHNAKDYGGGGHGYGVSIGNHATDCLVENNVFNYLRHAMIIARGANGNVFGFNYSHQIVEDLSSGYDQGDISIHGNYSFANLFEGNIAQFANADVYWGSNGFKNTLFRNRLEKMPTFIYPLEQISGGIRMDVATVTQYSYVIGNTVREGTFGLVQYLPNSAVENNNFNAGMWNESDYGGYPAGNNGISYYCSSQPAFLSGYSWPPVGCTYNNGLVPSENLPAKDRWNAGGVMTVQMPTPSVQNLYKITVKNDLDGNVIQGRVSAYQSINVTTPQWLSQASPATFFLPPNSTQQIRTDAATLPYNSATYRHQNWDNNQSLLSTILGINLNQDHSHTAFFKPSQPITLKTTLEGVETSGGSINYRDITVTTPYSDYGFMPPNSTAITAPLSFPLNTVTWKFINWEDGSTSPSRTVSPTSSSTYTANYKGLLRSSVSTAFANNSARKILRTTHEGGTEYLHLVYESAGRVWYEKLTSAGTTVVCTALTGTGAKNPSIAWVFDTPVVVYQEGGDIKVGRLISFTGTLENLTTVASTGLPSSYDLNPVVAGFDAGDFVVVWQEPQYGSTHPGGLYYVHGAVTYGPIGSEFAANQKLMMPQLQPPPGGDEYSIVLYSWYNPSVRISNTDLNSKYPAISSNTLSIPNGYHLVWQQDVNSITSDIKYQYATPITNGGVGFSAYTTPSSGSGWPHNVRPSIVNVSNGTARMSWIGGDEIDEAYLTIFKSTDYGYFWEFGWNVSSTSVNVCSDRYVVGWSEHGAQYITDSRTLSVIKQLNTTGNDLQLANSSSTSSSMYAMGFNNSTLPYRFALSNSVGSFGKSYAKIGNGRVGILAKDDAQFSFGLGDVIVDGKTINFKALPDTVKFNSAKTLSQHLETEPFTLTDASNFSYSVYYLVTDTAQAKLALGTEGKINYRVELVDEKTGKIVGVYNNITFSESHIERYATQGYEVSTKGIGSKQVHLRLVVQDNISPAYTIAQKYAASVAFLQKEGTAPEKLQYNETMAVTDYALAQNYPNPFNPSTTISYAIPEAGVVTVKVFDILGKEVATLINEYKSEGRYTVAFDASHLSSGIYIYRIQSGKYSATRKMQLLK